MLEFDRSYQSLTGFPPLRWQKRLFDCMLVGTIPPAVDLPTGLGKTSVMAIWLLARSMCSTLPRRLVYVVDRRAVVDQATREAGKLQKALDEQNDLSKIRRDLGLEKEQQLPVSTLRGQLADNREWLSDPTAPAIIVGTIDMIGSRLLFEGYGISRGMRPFHAGLLGSDTLFILDESHLCPPFEVLLRAVSNDKTLQPCSPEDRKMIPRFRVLPLSATGRHKDVEAFRLESEDYKDEIVERRLNAYKKLKIQTLEEGQKLADCLVKQALELGGTDKRILVYCDRRKDAEEIEREIRKRAKTERINLLVGARRVREHEKLEQWLEETGFFAGSTVERPAPVFLIATSAGEVGVDLDADHMVCDLVAFERMVQRLGRVNRIGEGSASIDVIAVPPPPPTANASDKNKQEYARDQAIFEARVDVLKKLPLIENNRHDASPSAIVKLKESASEDMWLADRIYLAMTREPLHPALSRALVDAWSMTSLKQHTGRPDIAPWLRGWVDDEPQTTVAWREFLPWRSDELPVAKEVNAFFDAAPIHLTETLKAPTREAVELIINRATSVLKVSSSDADLKTGESQHLTRGSHAAIILNLAGELQLNRANSLLSIWTIGQLAGLRDKSATKDDKDKLFSALIGQQVIISRALGGLSDVGLLNSKADKPPQSLDVGWREAELKAIGYRVFGPGDFESNGYDTGDWKSTFAFDRYGDEDNEAPQRIVVAVLRKGATRRGDPAVSRKLQSLKDHHDYTGVAAVEIAGALGLSDGYLASLIAAARVHDSGKDRLLWQRAMNAPTDGRPFAKTKGGGNGRLLGGYRHEFGSLNDANTNADIQKLPSDLNDLALHLIASHHGYARPLIPAIDPEAPPSVIAKRAQEAAFRFARLQRRWGPWGLAWWEAVFRAADWRASKRLDAQSKTVVK